MTACRLKGAGDEAAVMTEVDVNAGSFLFDIDCRGSETAMYFHEDIRRTSHMIESVLLPGVVSTQ